jgi:hypothetical protein
MSESQNQEPAKLEERLDEAGRLCQPRHPGWETLLARLPAQEPMPTPAPMIKPRRFPWRTLLATAASIFVVGLALLLSSKLPDAIQPAVAMNLDVRVERRGVQVTVFNPSTSDEPTLFMPLFPAPAPESGYGVAQRYAQALQMQHRAMPESSGRSRRYPGQPAPGPPNRGMALVRDQRMVLHLKAGDNIVRFTDVAAAIDPTSVTLVSDTDPIDTKVIEQNFEFDLASGDALLKRYVDRKVTCIGRTDERGKSDDEFSGYLVSFDPETIILAERAPDADPQKARPKTESIARARLKAIRCNSMPKDLYTRPTLVWRLRTKTPGDHLTTLRYLCGNVSWVANYVVLITGHDPDQGDKLDLKGWVSMDNRSGATYDNAGLKLIAGDVNRVRDPWAPRIIIQEDEAEVVLLLEKAVGEKESGKKAFVAKDFFEYKLYTLSQPSTIKDQQIKQLSLLEAHGIFGRRRFVFDPTVNATSPLVELVIQNKKENSLGRALPKGKVTLAQEDAEGEVQLLGRDTIDHTPKDEELKLKMGQAFDVTGEYRDVDVRRPAAQELVQTSEVRLRNHKDEDIDVRVVGHLQGYANWQITDKTDEFIKHDFQTVYFDFRLKANTEKTIRYTVDYQW